MIEDLAQRRADGQWDVAICLTDLPLHADRAPLATWSVWSRARTGW
ncbi:hypothetical protein [Micromonospora sp. MH99]|nr:hypothetical protein [Micromonospora sp. MH99]MCF0095650.1 hypothetical protein [Micromonospora sp. MH99]